MSVNTHSAHFIGTDLVSPIASIFQNDGLFPRGTSITERREKEKEAFVQILYISENGAAANESFQYSFYQEVIAYPGGALKSENIIR